MGRRAGPILAAAVIATLTILWRTPPLDSAANVSALDVEMVSWVNAERRWNDVEPVLLDGDLTAQAQLQATRMSECGCLYHSPRGEMGWWINRGWVEGVGENVGATNGQGILALYGVHLGFVASPGHRRNLLDPGYDGVGVAVSTSSDGRLYVAQFFGGV